MGDSFMQPQIEQGYWWCVETSNGTESFPGDLYHDECVAVGDTYDADNCEWFDEVATGLLQYCEGKDIQYFQLRKGWGCRLSAPGYMDCTEWSVFDTREAAEGYLKETYPEDEEEVGEAHE